ncbi:DNA helicase-2/ATP-dependent DNA helicase PcrA [Xanthomonas arboricola]|uniref:UvrD-helicase domain-containing protein n=1 Tax=Xanthomonas sp. 3793 TaxID=3035312 RepID=UPI0021673647|nr:UvrD-helicase domain-containing protein [Xanthomonas sp. 3793]MCS3748289.1 DNA helicase-2/ATP-dependent DNA helicase PcrA [Xanthomonas sp. 3793]
MADFFENLADKQIQICLDAGRSFSVTAGAGSGKTSSLVKALLSVRDLYGQHLRQQGQNIACITYTKRAVDVITSRLGFDNLYVVSTLHSFLWGQIKYFSLDIREALVNRRIPNLIARAREKDNGGNSKAARDARVKVLRLENELVAIATVVDFNYSDTQFSDYAGGQISHDDVIDIAAYLFYANHTFRRIIGFRFPYIFIDEAQDTFADIIAGLNLASNEYGSPVVGYFGDPWQQIYEGSCGVFPPPSRGLKITKTENFRCSESVIRLLNAFRGDVQQYAAGENQGKEGSVTFRLIKAENPTEKKNRYSEEQIDRALNKMDIALEEWGWSGDQDVIRLFLVRQMIARRLGFAGLNRLFTGDYASAHAQDAFENGDHFLVAPFLSLICPLIKASKVKDEREIIDVLRLVSPAFSADGPNSSMTLKYMIDLSKSLVNQLVEIWGNGTVGEVLRFCVEKHLIKCSGKLKSHLDRPAREEEYSDEIHSTEKTDWLADAFFKMDSSQLLPYVFFINKNTAFSTQHGVKGEEYKKVMVVYDDVEASWNNYSFSKLLTPGLAGEPTEKQLDRGQKLAYVSFSRAMEDLRVILFTPNPAQARQELISRGLLRPEQVEISE